MIIWLDERQANHKKDEMMAPMPVACPSFQEQWEQFLNEWVNDPILFEDGGDGSLPYYLALSEFANHLIAKLATGGVLSHRCYLKSYF